MAARPFHTWQVAKHEIPPLVELRWDSGPLRRRRGGLAPPVVAVPPPQEERVVRVPKRKRATEQVVEVLQTAPELGRSRFKALLLQTQPATGGAAAGVAKVRYLHLYASPASDELLEEVVDVAALRPLPPHPPDGFHSHLREGDQVEMRFEEGWWPVTVAAVTPRSAAPPAAPPPTGREDAALPNMEAAAPLSIEVKSDGLAGLEGPVGPQLVRPRWDDEAG